MRLLSSTRALLACSLLLAACSSTEGAPAADSPTTAATSETELVTDTSTADNDGPTSTEPVTEVANRPEPEMQTVVNADGEEIELLLLPSDLLEAVQAGVAEGSWTEVGGITAALDGLVGSAESTPGLTIDDAVEPGVTGLLRHAQDLLASDDTTGDVRAQLEAAIEPFVIDQQTLDAISGPSVRSGGSSSATDTSTTETELSPPNTEDGESASLPEPSEGDGAEGFSAGPGTKSAAAAFVQANPECERLEGLGFGTLLPVTGGDCYSYDIVTDNAGNTLTAYYPKVWESIPDTLMLVDATLEAGLVANQTFAPLATTGSINFVLGLETDGATLAFQLTPDPAESCPIGIHTPIVRTISLDQYRQTIAHEVFHCVQDQSFETSPYSTHGWWMEGSAEYFSNVAYPTVNFEHRAIKRFDSRSITRQPPAMNYGNTVFYQYYANRLGNPATIELLRTVAANGASASALANFAGMGELWQDFIVAFVAGQIDDTGGGTLAPAKYWTKPKQTVSEEEVLELELLPLLGTRYRIEYDKERRFVQDAGILARPHGMAVMENRLDPLAWTLFPPEIRTECDKASVYVFVATSVVDPEVFNLDVTLVEQAPCDPCVLGAWELQLATFAAYLNGSFPGGVVTIDGHYYFDFDENRNVVSRRQPLIVTVSSGGATLPPIEIRGVETGKYSADGQVISVSDIVADGRAGFAGGPLTGSGPDFLSGQESAYECDQDTLVISDLTFDPLVFDRIDAIPEPDSIDVEAGSTPE